MFRSESEFVHWLQAQAPGRAPGLELGIGDDAAIVRLSAAQDLILKTDISVEGVHFTRRLHPAASIGHRALARSLSDVAAMGGTPRFALVSLALSKQSSRKWVEELYAGILALANRFRVAVIGGDTAVGSRSTAVDVIVTGEVPRREGVFRSGARTGDRVFVSGRLGLSALGLRLLKLGQHGRQRGAWEAIRAHLYPQPRCPLGRFLAERHLASALIDVSDGLSTDLNHVCQASGVGARIWAERIPAPNVHSVGQLTTAKSLDLALHGGEDYELLFTVPARKANRVPRRFRGVPLQQIGEISARKEVVLVEADGKSRALEPAGYDHFRPSRASP